MTRPILYIGRAAISDSGKKIRRLGKSGSLRRSHIVRIVDATHEYIYHAIKGWRIAKL